METLRIRILNPKARTLLKGMLEEKLIDLVEEDGSTAEFAKILKKLRANAEKAPSMEEITAVVEEVRQERYGRK